MSDTETEAADFELDVNLADPEIREWDGESGPRLPPGTYDFLIKAATPSNSQSGNPVIKFEFEVLNEGEWLGAVMKRSYSLQKQALPRLKNLGMAVGARLDAIRASDYVGKQFVADIIHKMGDPQPMPDGTMKEGKLQADLIKERPADGAEAAPAPAPTPAPTPAKAAATTTAQPAKAAAVAAAAGTNTRRAVGSAKPSA